MAKHHYVPRYYLKPFTADSDESKVFSMSKDFTIHDEKNKISDICAKRNYNTPQQEQEQSQLEYKHSRILNEFIQNPNPETFYGSREFVESVSFLMGNNIYIRDAITKMLREFLENELGSEFDGDISDLSIDLGYRRQSFLTLVMLVTQIMLINSSARK